jgi:hypothetical protein
MSIKIKSGKKADVRKKASKLKKKSEVSKKNGNSAGPIRGIVAKDKTTVSKEGREKKPAASKNKRLSSLLGGLDKSYNSNSSENGKPDTRTKGSGSSAGERPAIKSSGNGSGSSAGASSGEKPAIKFATSKGSGSSAGASEGDSAIIKTSAADSGKPDAAGNADDVFEPGAEIAPVPNVDEKEPVSTVDDQTGTKETYDIGGREVSQTLGNDGSVVTRYEDENGVPHTETKKEDGSSTIEVGGVAGEGEDSNSREIRYDTEGQLVSDHVLKMHTGEDGSKREEIDNLDYGPDGKPLKRVETDETFSPSGEPLVSDTKETEYSPDGAKTVSQQVKNEDGTGFVSTRRVDPQGKEISSNRLNVGKDGIDPAEFSETLSQLTDAGDPKRLEAVLDFVGNEELAKVSLSASQADEEAFSDFVGLASEAAALSPEAAELLAGGLHDGLATNKYGGERTEQDLNDATAKLSGIFEEQIGNGGSSALGVSVVDKLNEAYRATETDNGVSREDAGFRLEFAASAVSAGFRGQLNGFDAATAAADNQSLRLDQLTANYGKFLKPEQLAEVTADFLETHKGEFDAADRASGNLVSNLDDLFRFQEILDDPDRPVPNNVELTADQNSELFDRLPDQVSRAGGTESGAKELGDALFRAGGSPDTSFLPKLKELATDDEQRARLFTTLETVGSGAAIEAVGKDNTARAEQILDGVGASSDNWTPEGVSLLKKFATGGKEFEATKELFESENFSPQTKARFATTASALGIARLVADGVDVFSGDADAQELIGFGADAVDVGTDVFGNALKGVLKPSAISGIGKVTSGVGLVLGAVDLASAIEDGDESSAALAGLSLVGGILVASNTVPIVGHVIAGVAAVGTLGLAQYRNTEESNYYEGNGDGAADATKFLEAALSDSGLSAQKIADVIPKLKDSDGDGNLPGEDILAVAKAAGVDPNELFNQIAALGPEDAGDLVNNVHDLGGKNSHVLRTIDSANPNGTVSAENLVEFFQVKYGLLV